MNIISFVWNLPRIVLSYLVLQLGIWLEVIVLLDKEDLIYKDEDEDEDEEDE